VLERYFEGEDHGFRKHLSYHDAIRGPCKRRSQDPHIYQATLELVQLVPDTQLNDFNVDLGESSMELIDHRR